MHNRALVYASADEVNEHSDTDNDTKYATRRESLGLSFDASTGVGGPAFEEINAVVHGGDERDGGFG